MYVCVCVLPSGTELIKKTNQETEHVPFWWKAIEKSRWQLVEWPLRSEKVEKEMNKVWAENKEKDKKEEDQGETKENDEENESENKR